MDINRLKYFCVIAKTGSITGASKVLQISAPALSKAMALFEEEMEMDLIHSAGRGIAITDAGKRVALEGERLLEEINRTEKVIKTTETKENVIKLGSFEVFTTYFLGDALKDIENTTFQIHELIPGKIENSLLSRQIDYGLTYLPIPQPGLEHLQIGSVKMGIFGQKKFESIDLEKLPFAAPIAPLSGVPTRSQGLDGWLPKYGDRKVVYSVAMMETALELCRQGKAVCFLPKFVVTLHNLTVQQKYQLNEIKEASRPDTQQPVFFVKRVGSSESNGIKKITQRLRILLRDSK
ncbi:MAG: hypothetical protein CL678_17220 [Bdellovibrionaceae bacterium]|nr:hypothetical protein [Pseudobdellovibrionaceae bacterium]|tara:strand:+ start:7462 stop:8340 length:879 start_codon:yes stop_codon:yes gene_type:complete